MLVRNDEITGFFQHEERAVKADVRDVNLEGGNDLGDEKAEKEDSSRGNAGMMEFWNVGKRHQAKSLRVMEYWSNGVLGKPNTPALHPFDSSFVLTVFCWSLITSFSLFFYCLLVYCILSSSFVFQLQAL